MESGASSTPSFRQRRPNFLAPYLDAVRAVNDAGELNVYPGSSVIARMLMRRDDV